MLFILQPMKLIYLAILFAVVSLNINGQANYSQCPEDANRQCPNDINQTDYLLTLKKGGTNILSNDTYLYQFFLCQEYNYDCGYLPESTSYINIANGVDLNMTVAQLDAITVNPSTQSLIQPYLTSKGDNGICGMKLFPLILTKQQSKQVLDGYMTQLTLNITNFYNQDRDATKTKNWIEININIRTAVLQKLKANQTMIRNSTFWTNLCLNNFIQLSKQLKVYYSQTSQLIDLHAAYLIDSVTLQCDKQQSVNFLVDQSGSIGSTNFKLCIDFLRMFVDSTNDNFQKMSMHFFSTTYAPYIEYGNNKQHFLDMINSKTYPGGWTYTGLAINQSVTRIKAANFPNGLPKILVILTDGGATDQISDSVKNLVNNGIIPIAVGIGGGVNETQLLQIAGNPSNYIQISSYQDLPRLVQFISNYFCKQILTLRLDQTIYGNLVRVPTSPSYFRVEKSVLSEGRYYELDITFEQNPVIHNQSIDQSQIDPFPDQFTQMVDSQFYEIYNESLIQKTNSPHILGASSFKPKKVYFIKPQNEFEYVVKKKIRTRMNATVSYVSVRGNNLSFNISLKYCKTLKCQQQIQYYKSITNKNKNNTVINQLILIPQAQDLSIFIAIGSTLGAIAALCCLFIVCYRRNRNGEQEQKNKRENIPVETVPTQQFMEQTLVPTSSAKKMLDSSKKSQKKVKSMSSQNSSQISSDKNSSQAS